MSHLLKTEQDIDDQLNIHPRQVSRAQFKKFEGYMAEIFSAFGMDIETPSTHETPHRFVRALYEATEGYDGDPKVIKAFETECRGDPDCRISQVVEGPINFYSLCEHHVFPFFGQAYVGYIANDRIIGISKLTRLVRVYAKRFAVQERIGFEIADALETILHPNGVAVYLEARHMCMEMRGVRETAPMTRTTVWRGNYAEDSTLRSEFFTACGLQR